MTRLAPALALVLALALALGTWSDPWFWQTADRRGDALLAAGHPAEAAKAYADPWRIGVAQLRAGDFASAERTFARVPGAAGAFDQGNARLMRGRYEDAIASYDRALALRPGWKEAEENKALAAARRAALDAAGGRRAEESANANDPDEVVFDEAKGGRDDGKPLEVAEETASDEALRASWLRRVRTTPAEFLRARFAYERAHPDGAAREARGR